MSDTEKENYTKYLEFEKLLKQDERGERSEYDFEISDDSMNRMNHDIIGNINDRAKKDDILWILGDVGFGNNFKRDCQYFLDQILCKHINLIIGNHDRREIAQSFSNCWDLVDVCIFQDGTYVTGDKVRGHTTKPGNVNLTLCHYAMASWNRSHVSTNGSVHLYGHSHGMIEDLLDRVFPTRKSLDVGVDNIYKLCGYYGPVNIEQIYQIFATKEEKLCQPQDLMI
jgi:calcineurin-like phosphoesterase family protein